MSFNTAGNLLYIPAFVFKDGSGIRNKYFLVVACIRNEIVVVSLPTSQDYVPSHLEIMHGCIDSPEDSFNCYHFECGRVICDSGFSFQKATFMYGEWVDIWTTEELSIITNYKLMGKLDDQELIAIIKCFKESSKVKRKIKRLI